MKKNHLSVFRFLLFLAGAGIVLLAFFLTTQGRDLTQIDAFVWTSIALMYLFFFVPFFASSINIGNFSHKIPNLAMIWLGIILYIIASVFVIVLLAKAFVISFNTALIIQAVLLFLFLIDVYFACFASSHISNVAAEEAGKKQLIDEIKSKAQVLSLSVNRLPAEYEAVQKKLRQTIEEIRYIYPADNSRELEEKILASLNLLSEICAGIATGAHSTALDLETEKLQLLIKERKLKRN